MSDDTPTHNLSRAPAPLPEHVRIDSLDVLRGIALLGIALMNVEYFTAPLLDMASGIGPGQHGLDWLADAFVYVFVQGKFWTLFSMLFGMGFAVMSARAEAAGRAFVPMYLRRTAGLLAIGLAHAWLVWAGDILVSYALAACLLLWLFRTTPTARLWKWGGGLWTVLLGLMMLAAVAMGVDPGADAPGAVEDTAQALRAAEIATYSTGSYAEATALRVRYFLHAFDANVMFVPLALGMFLLGAWLVRSGVVARPGEHRRLLLGLGWGGGLAGLALTAIGLAVDSDPGGALPGGREFLAMVLHLSGAPLMALALVAAVLLALHAGGSRLRVFAPAGRMALTHYLAQSVIGTLVFYGYGFGLWGEVSRAWQVLGVLLVFALQVAFSRWWLARFRYGPLEWLWRAFTYWQWPPMRGAAAGRARGHS